MTMPHARPSFSPWPGLRSFCGRHRRPLSCTPDVARGAVCRIAGRVSVDAMRPFACGTCRSLIFFENFRCVTCGSALGYDRTAATSSCSTDDQPRAAPTATDRRCNWLAVPGRRAAVRQLRAHPHPSQPTTTRRRCWPSPHRGGQARLVYQLDAPRPADHRARGPEHGLAFDLLSSAYEPVTTGHANGVITIDLAEGSDAHREALRVQLAEPYRTLLGHLRHEIGHWYWDVLVDGTTVPRRVPRPVRRRDAPTTPRPSRPTTAGDDRTTGSTRTSATTPRRTRGRTGPSRSPTTCTSATRCRPRRPGASRIDGPISTSTVAWDAQLRWIPSDDGRRLRRTGPRLGRVHVRAERGQPTAWATDALYPFVPQPGVLEKLRFVHVAIVTADGSGRMSWTVLVPLRVLPSAKSRLAVARCRPSGRTRNSSPRSAPTRWPRCVPRRGRARRRHRRPS